MIKPRETLVGFSCENFHKIRRLRVRAVGESPCTATRGSTTMHSTMDPAMGHDFDEPARPAWTSPKRTTAQAEPTEADEPPDGEPAAGGQRVTPALRELNKTHF